MKEPKVGSVVLATDQGLGVLAKQFFNNGIVHFVTIRNHSSRFNHLDWYPENLTEHELVAMSDVLLFFETPFNWKLIPEALSHGKSTVLIPMYECTPQPLPYVPDKIIVPSLLDLEYFPDAQFIPIPVIAQWKERKRARVFVHNAGNGGLGGRNGTHELLEAMRYVKSPIKLIIRSQIPIKKLDDDRIVYEIGQKPYEELFTEGDVFIFPEKFNGLSLPLQEAFASGMLVMCGNRFPMNTWLPNEPLIPVNRYVVERIAVEFQSAVFDPVAIAETIDFWYDKDITKYSRMGREYNKQNQWKKLKEVYKTALLPS